MADMLAFREAPNLGNCAKPPIGIPRLRSASRAFGVGAGNFPGAPGKFGASAGNLLAPPRKFGVRAGYSPRNLGESPGELAPRAGGSRVLDPLSRAMVPKSIICGIGIKKPWPPYHPRPPWGRIGQRSLKLAPRACEIATNMR